MKSYTTRILALTAFAFVLTATVAKAQSTDTITKVPFTFNVGASVMPPGTYRVSQLGGHTDVFMISGFRHSAILMSQPEGRTADDSPRLVFHRYGDRYFLREVRMAGDAGFSLPMTREERAAQEQIAGVRTPEVIVVLANRQ